MEKPDRRIELTSPDIDSMTQEELERYLGLVESIGGISLNIRVIESAFKKRQATEAKRRMSLPQFDKEILPMLENPGFEEFSEFLINNGYSKDSVARAWNGLARFSYKPENPQIIKERRPEKNGQKLDLLVSYNKQRQNSRRLGHFQFAPPDIINTEYMIDLIELANALENDKLEGRISQIATKTVGNYIDFINQQIDLKRQELEAQA
ncbi:hypothetical protein KW801_02780 [Candidatus Saccharibacteria bacterium]|nr:hypothetical protein [Candidatus Saccharibacteria bacterium]